MLLTNRRLTPLILSAVVLAGCSTPQPLVPIDGSVSPATPDPALPLPAEASAEPLPTAPEVPANQIFDADRLLTRAPADVQTLLGPPSLVRRDGETQIMLYEIGACVLDITFMGKTVGDGFAATYVAARDRVGHDVSKRDCLTALIDARQLDKSTLTALMVTPADLTPLSKPAASEEQESTPNG